MLKKLAPYTKGYRLLMLLAIACSAGEAVLELLLPQVCLLYTSPSPRDS